MGNWNITIQGSGCHHNGNAEIDADAVAKEMVQKLIKQGHQIQSALFTSGAEDSLLPVELNTRCNPGELQRLYDEINALRSRL